MDPVVKKQMFSTGKEAISHANELGLWPICQILEAGENEEVHWHNWDTHIYVGSGEFQSIEFGTNLVTLLSQGDYMLMPARKLHSATALKNTIVIYATKEPINFSKPFNLSPSELSNVIA
jgi:gentisate 1,2-dioxygenase